jgi:hypothetical protein
MADEAKDFFVRVPQRYKPELERRAQQQDRSVASVVRLILREAIESTPAESRS